MEFEEQVPATKKGKKTKVKKAPILDMSVYSSKSGFERSSIKSGMSRKRQQSIEEYLSNLVGQQFYDLVYKLSSE